MLPNLTRNETYNDTSLKKLDDYLVHFLQTPNFFKDVSFHVSFHVKFGYVVCCDFSIDNP